MILNVSHVDQAFRAGFWLTRTQVLFDVSLHVPERSIFGFLGANGAGKTTLIHLIVGLKQPVKGQITVNGQPAHSREARANLGYLPERPYFHEHLTGQGILDYFGTLGGMSRAQIRDRSPHVLKQVGMLHARDLELKKYSKGMLQRIGIAQALLHDPQFLVLDEPMSGLDPLGRKEIRELILELAAQGRTLFFSSHVIPDVEAICDQVALIKKGKIIQSGPIQEFFSQGKTEMEIVFKGLSIEKAKAAIGADRIQLLAEGMRILVEKESEKAEYLMKLLQARAEILWVSPVRHSLEELF